MAISFEDMKGLRILVAEDEALIMLDIEDMLLEIGCEIVGPVSTVNAALAAIRQNGLDGALLDMSLHGERIAPAAEELVARGIPFLLCTGYPAEPRDEAAVRNAPRLTKPINIGSLRAAMGVTFSALSKPQAN